MLADIMAYVASAFLHKVMDAKATATTSAKLQAQSVEETSNDAAPTPKTNIISSIRGKKRSIEELSPAFQEQPTAGQSKNASTSRVRTNEPASKKPRTTLNKSEHTARIKSMVRTYLVRHAAILGEHSRLSMAYSNRRKLAEDFEDIIAKTMNCKITLDLFADRMDELQLVANELRELEDKRDGRDSRIRAQIRSASRAFDSQALAFLDGPLLFHVFDSLQRDLRQRLYELNLPLKEIKQLKLELQKSVPGTLEQYKTTKEEAEVKTEEILRCLDSSYYDQEPEVLSYDDTQHRNVHDHCVEIIATVAENAGVTLAHTVGQVISTLEEFTRAQVTPHHTPPESTTRHVSSAVQSNSEEGPPRSQLADTDNVEDHISQEIAINIAAQEKAHEKSLEISAHQWQREEARRRKFLIDFQAYSTLIQQMKTYREGGPHPNRDFMKEIGMHDTKSCVHRLKHLWTKHSRAIQAHDVEQLRTDASVYMEAAICLREAHCILHMLLYYGSCWWDVAEAGWNLDQMRELQAEMVQWAHEDPLMYTKTDVDAICQALQDVFDQYMHAQAQASKPQSKAPSIAKKRDYPPRVYRQVLVAEQGPVPATTVTLPGLDGVGFEQVTKKPAAPAPSIPTILECQDADSDDDMTDVDRYEHICPQFLHGKGCTLADDVEDQCPYDHPYVLKVNSPCLYLLQDIDCPFGETGCKFVHNNILLPIEQQQVTHVPAPQASGAHTTASLPAKVQEHYNNGMIQPSDAQHYVLAPSGDAVDSRISGNYCNNFAINRCKTEHCRRIHQLNPNQQLPGSWNSQQNPPQGGRQASKPLEACSYHVHGRCNKGDKCSFSHDPHVIFQKFKRYPPGHVAQIGDARMGDAASNIESYHAQTQNKQQQSCRYEQNGPCTNKKCKFWHTNPQSAKHKSPQPAPPRDPQSSEQAGQEPQRAHKTNTWTPSQGIHFAPKPDPRVNNWRGDVAHADHQPQTTAPKCFTCNQTGHKYTACPQNNHSRVSNPAAQNGLKGACYTCGGIDHIARNCHLSNGNHGQGHGRRD